MNRLFLLIATFAAMALPAAAQIDCWTPREYQDTATSPKFAFERKQMEVGEALIRANAAYLAPPEPVRMRATYAAGPYAATGARVFVRAYPEKSTVGLQIWTGQCNVIPQSERVAASIGQIDIFFNRGMEDLTLRGGLKLTGHVAGYPEYNNWIVITKNGRLPWLPETMKDRLDTILEKRLRDQAEWAKEKASRKPMDEGAIQKTYAMLQKSDPAGAQRYLQSMRELNEDIRRKQQDDARGDAYFQKRVEECRRYMASLSPEQLRQAAVWMDPKSEARQQMDARIAKMRDLSPDEQRQADDWTKEGRALERQAIAEQRNKNVEEAARLRTRVAELSKKTRDLKEEHLRRVEYEMRSASDEYDLVNVKPGPADQAMAYKPDPTFPDPKQPNKTQVILISFYAKADPKQVTPRGTWIQRAKDTFDFKALAALLD